jgi:dTDP-4-amino-4,6-dideoxygalactose transaminase
MAAPVIRFLTPQLPPADAIELYFSRSRELRWFSNDGPCARLFSERSERLLGRGLSLVPTANCTLALMLALRALAGPAQERRREVIVPSFTFAATADAIVWSGFTPVFADVELDSWHLSAHSLETALTARGDRVAAVVACSTFGTAPPLALSRSWALLASEAGVPLIVDSAAGFGATDERGDLLGGQGDAEVFSFHATKPFAIGEGGALTTRDSELASSIRGLANFGFGRDRVVDGPAGLNAKLDEWHAAAALATLDSLPDILAARRHRADRIRATLEPLGFGFQAGAGQGTWQFVAALAPDERSRDSVIAAAGAAEIEVRAYFDPPLHGMAAFAGLPRADPLEATEQLAGRMLSLPMANDLSDEAIERIVGCVLGAVDAPTSDVAAKSPR